MEHWIQKHGGYLCGEEITIADLAAAHELDQTKFIDYDLTPYPHVKDWLHRVIDENPIALEIATPMRKFA